MVFRRRIRRLLWVTCLFLFCHYLFFIWRIRARKKKLCRSTDYHQKTPKMLVNLFFLFLHTRNHICWIISYKYKGCYKSQIYVTAAASIKLLIINISMMVMRVLYMYIDMITSAKSVLYSYQMLYGVRLGKSLHFNELFTL